MEVDLWACICTNCRHVIPFDTEEEAEEAANEQAEEGCEGCGGKWGFEVGEYW